MQHEDINWLKFGYVVNHLGRLDSCLYCCVVCIEFFHLVKVLMKGSTIDSYFSIMLLRLGSSFPFLYDQNTHPLNYSPPFCN